MKRFFVCLVCVCLMSSVVMAQKFSNSLGNSSATTYRSGTGKSTTKYNPKATVNKKGVVKTVLHYTPAQTALNEEHEKQIMPVIRRIQEGRTKSMEVVGIAREYNMVYRRMNILRQMFVGYVPNIHPTFRQITGAAVFNSNDNTVEIYEYY